MTRKGTLLAAGTGVIAFTIIAVTFQFRSATALPEVKARESGGSRISRLRLEIARRPNQAPPDSALDVPQSLRLFSPALFTVGILREDAILIPFASFDGASWFNPWPEPRGVGISSVPEVPQRLSEIPPDWWGGDEPALRWELLDPSGGRQVVTATGIREFQTHCTPNVGLTTNFQSRVEVERSQRYAGVAATVDNLLTPVARMEKNDRDFQAIERLLPQLFARLEPGVWESRAGSRFEALLTGSLPLPILNHVYTGTLPDGVELFTFNAHREVPRRAATGPRVQMATTVVGWFTRRGTAPLVLLDVRGSQSLNDQGGDGRFIPFVALTVVGRSFWLGNLSGYESEGYVVVEVGRDIPTVQVTAAAGGC